MARKTRRERRAVREYPDCAPEHCFWARDGNILKNVAELPAALRLMDRETFQHHVNEEKNDFANWVEHVFDEKALAERLRSTTSKAAALKVLEQ